MTASPEDVRAVPADSVTVRDVVMLLERAYPPELAADWDSVGLVVGSLDAVVTRVHFVLDVTEETVAEALAVDADMIVAHHPLLFRPVASVAETRSRGRIISALITNRIALYCAHTNADDARPGVSDALASRVGIVDLAGEPTEPIEAVPPGQRLTGTGRIGDLAAPQTLRDFAAQVERELGRPVRTAGDPERLVLRVAVCGGAGDSLLSAVQARPDIDVFVTADLRHHVVLDHVAEGGCALIDAGHWATESVWLPVAAQQLASDVQVSLGVAITCSVSSICTDPWADQ